MQGCSCDFQFGLCAKLEIAMLFVRATCFLGGHVVVGNFCHHASCDGCQLFFSGLFGGILFLFRANEKLHHITAILIFWRRDS